jgi:plasmid stabilization system protein ParE
LNFRAAIAPNSTIKLHEALSLKIGLLLQNCEIGLIVQGDVRETFMKLGRAKFVFRYRVTSTEVLLLRVWSGREDRP